MQTNQWLFAESFISTECDQEQERSIDQQRY